MDRYTIGIPPHQPHHTEPRPGPNSSASVSRKIADHCRDLRAALRDYEAWASKWAADDRLNGSSQTLIARYDVVRAALSANVGATVRCHVRTFSDLSLKAATLGPCTQFCIETGLLAEVAAGLLHDIQQIDAPVPAASSWRFPSLPLPTLWSGRQQRKGN